MGRRGPPKKPTELKLIQGVPGGKSKLAKNEPKPKKVCGARPPRDLPKAARKTWKDTASRLEALGLLTEIDLSALAQYCDVTLRWQQARDFLDKNGFYYAIYEKPTREELAAAAKDGSPVKQRLKYMVQFPQVNIYAQFGKQRMQLAAQFGMTPSARAGLGIASTVPAEKTELRQRLYGKR